MRKGIAKYLRVGRGRLKGKGAAPSEQREIEATAQPALAAVATVLGVACARACVGVCKRFRAAGGKPTRRLPAYRLDSVSKLNQLQTKSIYAKRIHRFGGDDACVIFFRWPTRGGGQSKPGALGKPTQRTVRLDSRSSGWGSGLVW